MTDIPQKSESIQIPVARRRSSQGEGSKKPPVGRLTQEWLDDNIKFDELDPNLFSDVAEYAAEMVHADAGNANRRTQLRRFYDELVMWNDRVEQVARKKDRQDRYDELAPFIKMLKAKVVYAKSRGHVDSAFTALFSHCLNKIENPETLRFAKFFLEAFTGFYRQYDS
jgi:CRISPR-associated protein Csm2